MRYVTGVIVLGLLIYLLSFAKYNWDNKNYLAAVGAALLGLAAFVLPLLLVFSNLFEI